MKIPYNRVRTISTAGLPGVICDPNLIFEFVANPSFEFMKDVSLWLQKPEWPETKRLAAELIRAVVIPGGQRIELGTTKTIQGLADETEEAFIGNLINGWNTFVSLERMLELKKNQH
jgi:hypothetical protein